MNDSLITRMEGQYGALSKSQKKIADYVLNNYEKATLYTAAKLGDEVGVSESTVVRFAIHMGFEGYPEFQKCLQETVKSELTTTQRMQFTELQMESMGLLDTIFKRDIDAIKQTREGLSNELMEEAADAVCNAKHIYIIGVRSSAPLADFLYFYLKYVFDNVKLIDANSSSEMFEEIFRITPDDICIALSFPRYSRPLFKILKYVKERGTPIIGITDSNRSPVAEIADYLLLAKNSIASFVDSMVAPMSVINCLIVACSVKRAAAVNESFGLLEEAWDEFDVFAKSGETDS